MFTQIRLIATSSLVGQNSSGAITVASTAATQTSTTPDIRGTYASSTATTGGALRVQIMQMITPTMLASVTASDATSVFGIAQYSSV